MTKKDEMIEKAKSLGIAVTKKMTMKMLQEKIAEQMESCTYPETVIDKNIRCIYHLADIHVRDNRRHAEFAAVFDSVAMEIQRDANPAETLIVIAGDIFDDGAKRTPSVEAMLLVHNWFVRLASLGTVIVFPGNHDFRESNTDVLEGLIIVTQKIHNLHYLRDSRYIIFNNLTITHSSLIDKKFITKPPVKSGCAHISIYHGTIGGSGNAGHSTRFRRESDFKNFDAVLLGDIHIADVWEYENTESGGRHTSIFGYPGSLLQQNHGESVTEHGMLLWKIGSGVPEAEFIEIPNNYAHITISPDSVAPDVSAQNLYVRLSGGITSVEAEKLLLGKNIIEIKNVNTENESTFVPPAPLTVTKSVENIVTECVTDIDRFHDVHFSIVGGSSAKTDIPAQSVWNINNLTVSGLFAFSDVISFKMEPGVTLISGQNGYGKTSLINSIKYAILHEYDDRQKLAVRNKNCSQYFTDCVFTVDGEQYIITDYNGTNINFETMGGRKLNGSQITATFKAVEKMIGMEWLQNCIFTLNRENFLQYTPQRRLNEIKKSDFALALWVSYETAAREKLKIKKRELDAQTAKLSALPDHSASIVTLKKKYESTMQKIQATANIVETAHISRDTSDEILNRYRNVAKPAELYDTEIAAGFAVQLQELNEKYYSTKLNDSELLQLKNSGKIELTSEQIENRLRELSDVTDKNYDYSITQTQRTISTLKQRGCRQISDLAELIPETECALKPERKPTAKTQRSRESILSDINAAKSSEIDTTEIAAVRENLQNLLKLSSDTIRVQRSTLQKFLATINTLQNPADFQNLYAELNDAEKFETETLSYNENVKHNRRARDSVAHYNYIRLKTAEVELENSIAAKKLCDEKQTLIGLSMRNSLQIRMETQRDLEKSIANVKHMITEYSKRKIEWENYNAAVIEIECILYTRQLNTRRELESAAQQLNLEIEIKSESERVRSEIAEAVIATKNSIGDLENYIQNCKKITTKLLHSKISVINDFVNKFLDGLIPGGLRVILRLSTDDKIDIEFAETKLGSEIFLGVSALSGYQSFLYNLAFATAMNKYCAEKSSRFIFIDECISTADAQNVEMLPVLFSRLLTVYESVNIISHLPSIKKYIDGRHITIDMNSGGKRVLTIE